MHKPIFPLGRLLFAGTLLATLSACDSGGSKTASFNLSPSQLPTNVVANGSLEASATDLSSWDAYTSEGSAAEATFGVDTADAYRGSHSFKSNIVALGEQPYDIEGGPVGVPVMPGQTYSLVAWAKAPAGAKANFTASLAEEPWTTFGNREVEFNGEWEQVAFTFTLPEDLAASTIRLPVQMNFEGNVGAQINIDDMQLIPTELPPAPPAGSVDLVVNGGLEASPTTAEGWASNANANTGGGTAFSVDSTEAHSGENSFKVAFGSIAAEAMPWDVEAGPTGVPVTEGETYTFSAWVKGSTGAKATFNVQMPGSPYHTYAQQEVAVTSEWQQVTFDALIADASTIEGFEGPARQVRLFTQMGYTENSGAEIYIDDVQLLTNSSELVTNGGLEASDTTSDEWGTGASEAYMAGTTFTVTSEEAQEGSNSLRVSFSTIMSGAKAWDIEAGPLAVPVTEGQTYVFSAWVKGTDGAMATFNVQLPESPYYTFGNQQVEVTSEWQQVTFEVLIVDASAIEEFDGSTTQVRLYVHMGYTENSNADIYIDNVSLTAK